MDYKTESKKIIWIATPVCALIGYGLGVVGFLIFGILGFILSFTAAKLYVRHYEKMTSEELEAIEQKRREARNKKREAQRELDKSIMERRQKQSTRTNDRHLNQTRRQIALDNKMSAKNVNYNAINHLACPYCGSDHVSPLGANRKGFSFGKSVGGALLSR